LPIFLIEYDLIELNEWLNIEICREMIGFYLIRLYFFQYRNDRFKKTYILPTFAHKRDVYIKVTTFFIINILKL